MEVQLVRELKGWSLVLEEEELSHKLLHTSDAAGLGVEDAVIEFCSFAEKRCDQT